jgi:hypothetical protein
LTIDSKDRLIECVGALLRALSTAMLGGLLGIYLARPGLSPIHIGWLVTLPEFDRRSSVVALKAALGVKRVHSCEKTY